MKLLYIDLARSVWMIYINELNPRGKNLYPAISWLNDLYKFKRLPPKTEVLDYVKGINFDDGEFINSSGDYMVHINDCSYYPYKWVEKHMLVCTKNFLSMGTRYFTYSVDFPIEKHLTGEVEIPEVQDKEISNSIEKDSHGIKDYLHINFGEHQLTSPQDFRLLGLPTQFLTQDNLLLEALPGWSYGGNTCVPTEAFLELNGFDEEYDKGFGWADCDFGIRAFNKGYKSFINVSNWCLEIQDKSHDLSPDAREKSDHNWKLYERACEQKVTKVNNSFNLREMRKETLERKNIKEE